MHLMLIALVVDLAHAFDWTLSGSNTFTAFSTSLTVPPVPRKPRTGDATYFYWPGLQTNGSAPNYSPIGFGVIQPVLTYGIACTPNQPAGADPYRGWHISAQYVTNATGPYRGCYGGNMMDVAPGDVLQMTMQLQGINWVQTVTRTGVSCSGPGTGVQSQQGCQVSFTIDMSKGSLNGKPQGQNRALLALELFFQAVVTSNVQFNNIVLVAANPEPVGSNAFCTPTSRMRKVKNGVVETCSGMVLSADGKTCNIQQCLFTAPIVPVTPSPSIDPGSQGGIINPSEIIMPLEAPPQETSTPTNANSTSTASTPGVVDPLIQHQATPGNDVNSKSSPKTSIKKAILYAAIGCGVAVCIAAAVGIVYARRGAKPSGFIESQSGYEDMYDKKSNNSGSEVVAEKLRNGRGEDDEGSLKSSNEVIVLAPHTTSDIKSANRHGESDDESPDGAEHSVAPAM